MNVCVFCSASDLPAKYTEPAQKMATLLAENGHNLVWGGSNVGLMRDIATSVQAAGGQLVGVSMELLKHTARKDADQMIIAKDLGERKALMLEHSDAIVALVGGTGTLDELTDVFELRRHGVHDKPIIVLNTENFYDGLKLQFQHMRHERFLDRMRPLDELITFVEQPEDVIGHLKQTPGNQAGQMTVVSAEV
ncbi:MAG TPA: TIGR00730 family Rossman fold protein [Candidatus Saccharimonadales bacterium]|nr:TIGR00730 family Rossman fold protein [Candidatus Saccharimonadales bacterium]